MAMVVQHNMQAMNSNRMLGVNMSQQAKSTEKLSSGYKINRAADDAAGLSISEKMRKQMRGLDRASTNAQDGVSAVQTAEGALNEVHDMLQRMNELAVQAANGTNSESDRQSIQDEISQLTTEIDRVAQTTKFNETYLLIGDGTGKHSINLNFKDAGFAISMTAEEKEISTNNSINDGTATLKSVAYGTKITIGGKQYEVLSDSDKGLNAANLKITQASCYKLIETEMNKANNIGASTSCKVEIDTDSRVITYKKGKQDVENDLALSLHVGADADETNKITFKIQAMDCAGLGLKDLNVADENGTAATYAIDAIADAIATVSAQRSGLGAIQNRLEHTIANLDNVVENTTAAESRIRDTDMAEEMVTYSKNNILAQAGQSMLAQANQSTQGVLSLL